ncbi:MAG: TIGR02444 family protein [Alphaproteobacteria bacterium]
MDFPKSAFWDFTLAIYGREGVSPAVIALQDKHGLDVDILLFCCWTGSTGRGALGAAEIARAKTVADPWQSQVVNALRTIRRRIKDGFEGTPTGLPDALRKQILSQEIDAERLEQIMLEATVTVAPDVARAAEARAANAAASLAVYLKACGVKPGEEDLGHLSTLVGAAFTELGSERAKAAVRAAF